MTAPALPLPPEREAPELTGDPMLTPNLEALAESVMLSGLDALAAELPLPLSDESAGQDWLAEDEAGNALTIQEDVGAPAPESITEDQKAVMSALYGPDFPLLNDQPNDEQWAKFPSSLWDRHGSGVTPRLHLVERNRLMVRKDQHWISSVGGSGPWREPPKPKDASRPVDNVLRPACDLYTAIVSEQRPGFRARPKTQDPRHTKKAEAQQIALEYQWDEQSMQKVIREASYWSRTDGVAFLCTYWDSDAGPWDEYTGVPKGDPRTKVYRIEQVRVSSGAAASQKPWYWVTKETMSRADAVRRYGEKVVKADQSRGSVTEDMNTVAANRTRGGFQLPDYTDDLADQETVDRYVLYCDKSSVLKQGLVMVVVGKAVVVPPMPLPWGVVPIARFTDGSTDPSWFPQPVVDGWIPSQQRINALKAKWIESIRINSGGKIISRANALVGETMVGGGPLANVEYRGQGGDIRQDVFPLPAFSIGGDAKELYALEMQRFEQITGWNDVTRGSFSSDQSGRSILAQREQVERAFAPAVNAAAECMVEWAKIQLAAMKANYDQPRVVSIEGASRPDLARELIADDFDGVANVTIDPETLMPLPRAMRLFLLDSLLDRGLIAPDEYRRRLPFGFTQNLDTPDTDDYARAKRCVEAIRQSGNAMALPVLWMDNEAIHMDVLRRELILPDDLPEPVRSAGFERWMMYSQQLQMKQMGMPMDGPGATLLSGPSGSQGKDGPQMDPKTQPLASSNPGISAGSASQMAGTSDQQQAGAAFDRQIRQ